MTSPIFSSQLRYPPLQEGFPGGPSALYPWHWVPAYHPSDATWLPAWAPARKLRRAGAHLVAYWCPAPSTCLRGSFSVEWIKEDYLEKEEELGKCYVTENKGKGKTSATAKGKLGWNPRNKHIDLTTEGRMLTDPSPNGRHGEDGVGYWRGFRKRI